MIKASPPQLNGGNLFSSMMDVGVKSLVIVVIVGVVVVVVVMMISSTFCCS